MYVCIYIYNIRNLLHLYCVSCGGPLPIHKNNSPLLLFIYIYKFSNAHAVHTWPVWIIFFWPKLLWNFKSPNHKTWADNFVLYVWWTSKTKRNAIVKTNAVWELLHLKSVPTGWFWLLLFHPLDVRKGLRVTFFGCPGFGGLFGDGGNYVTMFNLQRTQYTHILNPILYIYIDSGCNRYVIDLELQFSEIKKPQYIMK